MKRAKRKCGINIAIRFDNMVGIISQVGVDINRSYTIHSVFLNNLFKIHLVNKLIYQLINPKSTQ